VRLHITLDEEVVRELDRRVGPRRRSSFIAEAVTRASTTSGAGSCWRPRSARSRTRSTHGTRIRPRGWPRRGARTSDESAETVPIDLLRGPERRRRAAARASLCGRPSVHLAGDVDEIFRRAQDGRRAGEWRRAFRGRGRTLAQADCLIAAAALAVGGRLATGDPKHVPMPELTVEHRPAGE